MDEGKRSKGEKNVCVLRDAGYAVRKRFDPDSWNWFGVIWLEGDFVHILHRINLNELTWFPFWETGKK